MGLPHHPCGRSPDAQTAWNVAYCHCPGMQSYYSVRWHAGCLLLEACTQVSSRRPTARLLSRLALQSSTLGTFQQILAACGGTAITGAACPAPPPDAASPSAPPITAVTLAWAYAVRVNPTTIAVRRETSRVACLRRHTQPLLVCAHRALLLSGFVQIFVQLLRNNAAGFALVC